MFRVLGCVDALNGHLYECHSQADRGYYLKSRSPIVRLISYLLKSNKVMKDDYLIASKACMMVFIAQFEREWQVGYFRVRFNSKRLRDFFFFFFLTLALSSYPCHYFFFFGERIRFSNCALLLGYACR